MQSYSLGHLADRTLLLQLAELVTRDRTTTAALLAHIAEVDERKLYAPAGYPSMYHYCVGELKLSEDAAAKRIHAARAARKFPAIFHAVADGRLHLSGLVLLAPHFTQETVHGLLAAAAHKTKAEIGFVLAERFPKPDLPDLVRAIAPPAATRPHAPGHVGEAPAPHAPGHVGDLSAPATPEMVESLAARPVGASPAPRAPGQVNERDSHAKLAPLSPQRFALQTTIDKATHDKLRYAQELLGPAIPSGDMARVLDRALDALIRELEKRKFGAVAKPRARSQASTPSRDSRRIPAHIRRAVAERDAGRCTFTNDTGHRCEARKFLEFDHAVPFASGGQSTVANLRLRCRAHNQLEAERAYGPEFMRLKREAARGERADVRQRNAAEPSRAEAILKARAATKQVRAAVEASSRVAPGSPA